MKYISKLLYSLSILLITLSSCTKEEPPVQIPSEPEVSQTIKMNFLGEVIGYDNAMVKASETDDGTSTWKAGDKIYLMFNTGNSSFTGEAVYSAENGWEVSHTGSFTETEGKTCSAYYFVNADNSESHALVLTEFTEIYEAPTATYSFLDNTLTVQATLKPKTGRVKFTGKKDAVIHVVGLTCYNYFTFEDIKFYSAPTPIKLKVGESGSTPYIYGFFEDPKYRNLGVVTATEAFTRELADDMLIPANSGQLSIPTRDSHPHWKNNLYIRAGGAEFKMIAVAGHEDGFFLIAETEVTNQLYNAVMGNSATTSLQPATSMNSNYNNFLNNLKNRTHLNFAIPTYAQWSYAASGGNKSKGYIYSGSDNIDDVAWYSSNSNNTTHDIKQKKPNELGIYDMTGNMAEAYIDESSGSISWILSYYATNANNSRIGFSSTSSSPSYNYAGLRISLTFE